MTVPAKVEISKRIVAINSAAGIALSAIDLTLLVWLYRHLLQRISPEEYALYPPVASIMAFLPLLTVILSSGLERYMVEAYAKGDERLVTQIVSTMFPLHLAAGLAVVAVAWLLSWQIGRVLDIAPEYLADARIMVILMNVTFVVPFVLAPFHAGFQIRQKLALLNLSQLAAQLTRMIILLTLIFGVSPRVLWVVVASTAANVPWSIVNVMISRRLVPALRFRPGEIRWSLARRLTSFGGWMFLGQISGLIRHAADPIILNRLATPLDVTCFHLGSMPDRRIGYALVPFFRALLPQTTAMHATDSRQQLRNTYLRVNRYVLWAGLFVGVPMIIFSRELVRLWVGDRFLPAATVMALLLAMMVARYAHGAVGNIAVARGRVRELNIRGLALELVNLGATLYLVGVMRMGAVGSALGSFIAVSVGYPLVNWPLGFRLSDVTFREWLWGTFVPGVAPALSGALVWLTLKRYVCPSTLLSLGICIVLGMIVYGIVLATLCLQPTDRVDLKKAVRWMSRGTFTMKTGLRRPESLLAKMARAPVKS